MSYTVVFTPEAEEQLAELYQYIAGSSSPRIAARYTGGIVDYCEELQNLPHRGAVRNDIRPGIRIIGYRRRVAIAFTVDGDVVSIIGVFYGGQDYETALRGDAENQDSPE
jgi:plasmid stabilization system protein ParE